MKLTSLRIITRNIRQSVQFYEKAIGITAQWYTEDFAEIPAGSVILAIGSTRTMKMFSENLTKISGHQSAIIEFLVDDVDQEYERIKTITNDIVQKPVTMPWGNRSLLFCDPDGNLINFFTPVSEEAIKKFR